MTSGLKTDLMTDRLEENMTEIFIERKTEL